MAELDNTRVYHAHALYHAHASARVGDADHGPASQSRIVSPGTCLSVGIDVTQGVRSKIWRNVHSNPNDDWLNWAANKLLRM